MVFIRRIFFPAGGTEVHKKRHCLSHKEGKEREREELGELFFLMEISKVGIRTRYQQPWGRKKKTEEGKFDPTKAFGLVIST